MEVLQLDMSGRPQAWISAKEAAVIYASDASPGRSGELVSRAPGGVQRRTGIAVADRGASDRRGQGSVPSRAWRRRRLANPKLFARDRGICATAPALPLEDLTASTSCRPRAAATHLDELHHRVPACNGHKGNRLPEEARMSLTYLPVRAEPARGHDPARPAHPRRPDGAPARQRAAQQPAARLGSAKGPEPLPASQFFAPAVPLGGVRFAWRSTGADGLRCWRTPGEEHEVRPERPGPFSLAGCATPYNADVVHPYEAQRISTIWDATVLSVRPVTIGGHQTGAGAAVGAVTGSVVAANAASYKNSGWAGLVGFVVGGLVGNAVEQSATTQNGVELLLQMRNGERRSIVQANGNEGWMVGEPVVLVTTAGRTRVTRAPQGPGQRAAGLPRARGGAAAGAGVSAVRAGAAAQLGRLSAAPARGPGRASRPECA